jgi:Cft2 family RNA processing exonuclease
MKNLKQNLNINKMGGIEVGKKVVIDGPIINYSNPQILIAISHAHTDHANEDLIADSITTYRSVNPEVIMTHATKELLGTTLNSRTANYFKGFDYQTPYPREGVEIQFLDANHMLGSAQVKVVDEDLPYSIGYSGDIGRDIEKPIDVDVLVLDATYDTFFDKRTYNKEKALKAMYKEVNNLLSEGKGFNIVAHSGLMQTVLHGLAEENPNIWIENPTVLAGAPDSSPKEVRKIKHFCDVYRSYDRNIPEVISIKDPREEERVCMLERNPSRIALFSNIEHAQNNNHVTFTVGLTGNIQTPIQETKLGFRISISEHDTGDTISKYIEGVNPELVVIDSHRQKNIDKAEHLSSLIQEKLGIESITSNELNNE